MLKKIFTPSKSKLNKNNINLPLVFKAKLISDRVHISAPEAMCVYEDQYSYITYQFLEYIEKVIFIYKISLTIDFSEVKTLTAAASLLIFARITKCQMCVNKPTAIDIIQPLDKSMKKLFSASGLWAGIKPGGISKVRKLIDTNNPYMSGSSATIEDCPKVLMATLLCLAKQGVKFNADAMHIFTRGVQEAILNVDYHAYGETSLARSYTELGNSRWWQCSWLDKDNGQLVFIIFDDGDGIANTLKNIYPHLTDSQLIEKAMTFGVTRTKNPARGKGSENIIQTSCEFPNSHLVVLTGHGYYMHDERGIKLKDLPFEIEGTVIQWVLSYSDEDLK